MLHPKVIITNEKMLKRYPNILTTLQMIGRFSIEDIIKYCSAPHCGDMDTFIKYGDGVPFCLHRNVFCKQKFRQNFLIGFQYSFSTNTLQISADTFLFSNLSAFENSFSRTLESFYTPQEFHERTEYLVKLQHYLLSTPYKHLVVDGKLKKIKTVTFTNQHNELLIVFVNGGYETRHVVLNETEIMTQKLEVKPYRLATFEDVKKGIFEKKINQLEKQIENLKAKMELTRLSGELVEHL